MYASSIDSAYQLSKAFPRIASKGVLVGKHNYSTLSPEDQEQLALVAAGISEEVVSQFRSLLMPAHGSVALLIESVNMFFLLLTLIRSSLWLVASAYLLAPCFLAGFTRPL